MIADLRDAPAMSSSQRQDRAGGTRSDSLELGAYPEAVGVVRNRTRAILTEWGLDELGDDAATVISELAANAVTATRAAGLDTPVRVTLLGGLRTLLVAVWDASPEPPVPGAAEDDDENGRGLLIVQALSARWDWKQSPGRGGKVVRALIRPDARLNRMANAPGSPPVAATRVGHSRQRQRAV
jgi:anti-sigma regulatory factor (Ser/Thr protein kinase)